MRKLIASLIIGVTVTTSIAGGMGNLSNPVISKTCYSCNWQYNSQLQCLQRVLRNYGIKMLILPYKVRIVIPERIVFEPATNTVMPGASAPLQYLAYFIKDIPYSKIKVLGYTSNMMSNYLSKKQSLERAQIIAGRLWENGVPEITQVLAYTPRGAANPIADNHFVNGMADNRRIEVILNLPRSSHSKT